MGVEIMTKVLVTGSAGFAHILEECKNKGWSLGIRCFRS